MAAILSSRQSFLLEVIAEVENNRQIALVFPTFWAFDRCSNSNIDGDISILKFDLLCDLVTSPMTSWICIHTNVLIISRYLCTGSLMMISLLVFLLSWKMLLFHLWRNIKGRLWGQPVTPSMASSSWKIFFWHNLVWSFQIWGQIEAVFDISKFSKWPPFWARDKLFLLKAIPVVEYTRKIAISISDILSFWSTLWPEHCRRYINFNIWLTLWLTLWRHQWRHDCVKHILHN